MVAWLSERLAARPDARLEVTRAPGDAERWAAEVGGQHDRIIAVGGDGTVQEVANGVLAARAPAVVGLVPVGSGNDLARSLGLSGEPAEAWSVAIGRGTAPIDVALARGADRRARWFVSAGGIGFDAQVAGAMTARRRWQRGRLGYLLTALAELRRFPNRQVRIALDGAEPMERRILLVALSNGAFYGGGMHIAPGALADDGWLDLCIVGDISRLGAIGQLPNLYRGRHTAHPAVEMRRARRIEIDGDPETLVHLDGEPFGRLPLRVEVQPGRLTVAVPVR